MYEIATMAGMKIGFTKDPKVIAEESESDDDDEDKSGDNTARTKTTSQKTGSTGKKSGAAPAKKVIPTLAPPSLIGLLMLKSKLAKWKAEHVQPKTEIRYEPTYIKSPAPKERFMSISITKLMNNVLNEYLKAERYNASRCPDLCTVMAEDIKRQVCTMNMPRYKIVCYVMIAQKRSQGLAHGSRAIWDHTLDDYASAVFENRTLVATAVTFGSYYE